MLGRCSECGLEFEWSEMFLTGREPPRWLVESRRGWFLDRFLKTAGRTLGPRRFWRAVMLWHEVRLARLAAWILTWAALWYLVVALAAVYSIVQRHQRWLQQRVTGAWDVLERDVWRAAAWAFLPLYSTGGSAFIGSGYWYGLAFMAWGVSVLAFAPLSTTLGLARVRFAHIIRAWAYALAGTAIVAIVSYVLRAAVANGWLVTRSWNVFSSDLLLPDYPPSWPSWWRFTLAVLYFLFDNSVHLPVLVAAWLYVFWSVANRRYLKIRHPRSVAAVVTIVGILGGLLFVKLAMTASFQKDIDLLMRLTLRWWGSWV